MELRMEGIPNCFSGSFRAKSNMDTFAVRRSDRTAPSRVAQGTTMAGRRLSRAGILVANSNLTL